MHVNFLHSAFIWAQLTNLYWTLSLVRKSFGPATRAGSHLCIINNFFTYKSHTYFTNTNTRQTFEVSTKPFWASIRVSINRKLHLHTSNPETKRFLIQYWNWFQCDFDAYVNFSHSPSNLHERMFALPWQLEALLNELCSLYTLCAIPEISELSLHRISHCEH